MQQEQLQRRLEMEQNSKKGSIIKRQSSLDRVEKIQNGLTKSDTQDVSLKLGREAVADDDNMTTSSRGSSGSSKQKRSLQQKEVPAEKSPSDESPTSTSTRRSKRAKTIPSYNVTDLAKNNIISNEIKAWDDSPGGYTPYKGIRKFNEKDLSPLENESHGNLMNVYYLVEPGTGWIIHSVI